MSSYEQFENIESLLPDLPEGTIVSRKLYDDDKLRVILFGFAPGQMLSEHTAAMPATLHFLQGTADVTLGTDSFEAGPGFWTRMEANLAHSIVARDKVVMLLQLLKG